MSVTIPVWAFALALAVVFAVIGDRINKKAPSGGFGPAWDGCGWWLASILIVVVTASVCFGMWIGGGA